MAALNLQKVVSTGLNPTFAAASGAGDTFPNTDGTLFYVKNGGGSPVTVTFIAVKACNQGQLHDMTVSVPASGERIVGPIDPSVYADPATGRTSVTYSATTSVTVAAIKN